MANPVPYANKRPTDLGNHLREVFNLGAAPITQTPGAAHPSTRQFYDNHKGYDFGTAEGTAIKPGKSGKVVKSYTDNSGYGNRALVQFDDGEQYFLSHLRDLPRIGAFGAGQAIAWTGGTPGKWGSGNTTGAHLDIERAGADAFNQIMRGLQGAGNGMARRKADIGSLVSFAKQKYGNKVIAVANDPNKLTEAAKKYGGKIIRI